MSYPELDIYTTLKSDLKLSDESALRFVHSLEKLQQESSRTPIEELSDKMDLKFDKIDLKLEKLSNEMDSRFKDFSHEMDLRFEQTNTRFEQVYTRIENIKGELINEVKESRNETLKWFICLFFALALMILSLYLKK